MTDEPGKDPAASNTPVSDLLKLKNYALGTLAFGTAVTTFLTQVFHTPLEATLLGTTFTGALFLVLVYLIFRSEQRSKARLITHMQHSDKIIEGFNRDLAVLKQFALENQRSSLRTEMDNEIYRNPENHDTIIKYAYRYFKELGGDWVETDKFLTWVDSEKDAGRKVHLPADLMKDINEKADAEAERM